MRDVEYKAIMGAAAVIVAPQIHANINNPLTHRAQIINAVNHAVKIAFEIHDTVLKEEQSRPLTEIDC